MSSISIGVNLPSNINLVIQHQKIRPAMRAYFQLLRSTAVSACLISQFGLILWQKTSDCAHFFLVRATKKKKRKKLDQKIPQKNYRRCKSCLSVLEHLKKQFFSKIFLKKSKNICEIQLVFNIYSFHSIVLPLCVSKQFSLSMQAHPKKKCARSEVFFPYWVV